MEGIGENDEVALRVVVPGKARGKQRPRAVRTKKGIRVYTPDETLNAEAWVRHCCVDQVGRVFLRGPLRVELEIVVEVPASWSGKKTREALGGGLLPVGKPDVDNTAKLVLDALNGITWADDTQVVELLVRKVYGPEPEIGLVITPLTEPDVLEVVCGG